MKFIEMLIESFRKTADELEKALKKSQEEYNAQKLNWCIGSGSNFCIYENKTRKQAEEIYENYKEKLNLGSRKTKKEVQDFIAECYNCLESSSNETYTFKFTVEMEN